MASVRSAHTKSELIVRSYLHKVGLRFTLHRDDLPGSPDIVLQKYRSVVMVHGCFWHQHPGCSKATIPESNQEFWKLKLNRNVERDRESIGLLESAGWRVHLVREFQLDAEHLTRLVEDIRGTG